MDWEHRLEREVRVIVARVQENISNHIFLAILVWTVSHSQQLPGSLTSNIDASMPLIEFTTVKK